MRAHIGLSFCVESINFSIFLEQKQVLALDRLGSIPYPFEYNERDLFNQDEIKQITTPIEKEILSDLSADNLDLSVSIESNLAILKRTILPRELSKEDERDHLRWDLSQYLLDSVDGYIYTKTVNYFETDNQKDYLVLAMRKNVIAFFQKLCNILGLNLVDISVNQLVTEIILQNILQNKRDGFISLFKLGSSRLESTYLFDGNYYLSHYDRITENQQLENLDKTILNKMKSKIKQMENLFEQLTKKPTKINRIFLYGEPIDDDMMDLFQNNISVVVFRLNPLQNIEKTQNLQASLPKIEDFTRYVEPIGVVLDQ